MVSQSSPARFSSLALLYPLLPTLPVWRMRGARPDSRQNRSSQAAWSGDRPLGLVTALRPQPGLQRVAHALQVGLGHSGEKGQGDSRVLGRGRDREGARLQPIFLGVV